MDESKPSCYIAGMTLEELRRAKNAAPFVPFDLCLVDGRILSVDHPEFIGFAPVGRTIAVGMPDGSHELVDSVLIVSIKPRKNGARRKKS